MDEGGIFASIVHLAHVPAFGHETIDNYTRDIQSR
jgi:hypothetical protein